MITAASKLLHMQYDLWSRFTNGKPSWSTHGLDVDYLCLYAVYFVTYEPSFCRNCLHLKIG